VSIILQLLQSFDRAGFISLPLTRVYPSIDYLKPIQGRGKGNDIGMKEGFTVDRWPMIYLKVPFFWISRISSHSLTSSSRPKSVSHSVLNGIYECVKVAAYKSSRDLLPPRWRSGSWSMPTTDYSYIVIFIECILTLNLSFCTHDIYCFCPSWRGILLCCSPEGFFPVFLVKVFFLFLGSFSWSNVRSWDRNVQRCTDWAI